MGQQPSSHSSPPVEAPGSGPDDKRLHRHPWCTFIVPFFVYWVFGTLEPTAAQPGGNWIGLSIGYDHYSIVYSLKIAATLAAMAFVLRGYRAFRFRVSLLSVLVGAVGTCFWIGICSFHLEEKLLGPLGLGPLIGLGERSSFNPLQELSEKPTWAYLFFAIRFLGLVLVVPIIEEFFNRGFLMRYVMEAKWWTIPFGDANRTAIVVGTVIPMLMHPGELFAAAVWFSLVTWLMLKTRNIWDCVAAHVVTNLLMGVYVVVYDHWELM